MTYLSLTWRPRTYYIMRNKTSGKLYVGQTTKDITRYRGSGGLWINHCKKHGGHNKKNIEVLWSHYFICEKSAQMWLDQFAIDNPGYDSKMNEAWANECLENTKDSALAGDGSLQRRNNEKRLAEGTHNLQGDNNPSKKSAAIGEHHFQNFAFQSATQQKLVAEGRHIFLTEKNPSKKPEVKKRKSNQQKKLIVDGNHNFSKNQGHVACYDKLGNYINVPSEIYLEDKAKCCRDENKEYAHVSSKIGKQRKSLLL